MEGIGNSFVHRRFVGCQEVAVIIVMITRLTEGIYIDVSIGKLQMTGFDPLNSHNLRSSSQKIIIIRTFTCFWTAGGAVYTTSIHSREDLDVNRQPLTCASCFVTRSQHDLTTPACTQHITVKGLLRDVVSADGEIPKRDHRRESPVYNR